MTNKNKKAKTTKKEKITKDGETKINKGQKNYENEQKN